MKRAALIFTFILLISTAVVCADVKNNITYCDVATGNWAYEAVNTMSQKGIVKGYSDGSFKPSNVVTYGEFIKMALVVATGEDIGNAPAVNPETGGKQNWAKNYYDKALELKYFGSTDIKEAQLSKHIPRGDMALIISNILGEIKVDNYNKLEEQVKDVNSETKHDYDIIKVYGAGIITGYQDSSFKPDNTLTRAESATVIYRLVDESKRIKPDVFNEEVVKNPIANNEVGNNSIEKTEDGKNFVMVNASDYYDINSNPFKAGLDSMNFTDKAEYYEDATPWNIKIFREFNGKFGGFDADIYYYFIYLIKDEKMYFCDSNRIIDKDYKALDSTRAIMETLDIREADYVICVPTSSKEHSKEYVKIINNPLKTI